MRKDYIVVIILIMLLTINFTVNAKTKDEEPYVGIETTGAAGLRGANEFIVIKDKDIKKNKEFLASIEKLYKNIQTKLKIIEKAKPDLSIEDSMRFGILIDSINNNLDEMPNKDGVIIKPLAEEIKKVVDIVYKSTGIESKGVMEFKSELDKNITELEQEESSLAESAGKK